MTICNYLTQAKPQAPSSCIKYVFDETFIQNTIKYAVQLSNERTTNKIQNSSETPLLD